ncbi:MAG: ECF transporter S component [Oscillospiraceae bacterium]|nr:ECF transporter S component [Oscillospiraceae bacterium]
MLDVSKMNVKQRILLVAALSTIFVFVAVPFKVMSLIPGFTEIRPVNCFNMLFGLLFGIYGAFGCAIGNLIGDCLGGTLAISSWAGFAGNFLGTYLAYVIWYKTVKKRPYIRCIREVFVYAALTVLVASLIAGIIAFGVGISFPEVSLKDLSVSIITNNVVFSILLGLPLLITAENVYNVIGLIPKHAKEDKEGKRHD